MDTLDKTLDLLCRLYLRISPLLLGLMVLGVLSEVVMRYFLSRGILGSGEIMRLAITWVVFLMAAVLYRRRRHIVVTALVDVMPPKVRHVFDIVINVSVVVLSGYVLLQLFNVWDFLGLTTPVFKIPDTAFKIAPVFCFVPMALQSLVNIVRGSSAGGVPEI